MGSLLDIPPFQLSTVFSDLYHAPDLLDLTAPGPSSPPSASTPSQPSSASIFASATSIAAAAGRRAAAAASAAASSSSDRNISDRPRQGDHQVELKCLEGYGDNLYVGRSDGVVEWWTCEGAASESQQDGWTMRHHHTLFPRRPVSRIIILPKIQRMFVLSEGTLHPFALPNLELLPSTVIQPLRGIISVVLDDEEMEWGGPGSEVKGAEMTMVVVRRTGLGIYRVGQRLIAQKDIPLPSAPTTLALTSKFLCATLPHSANYALIDLSDASLTELLPVSHLGVSDDGVGPNANIAVIPGENEFLVTSFTEAGSMGVFLNEQGDPVRGTLEWPDYPLSLAIESGFIIALLRNQTLAIHSLDDLEKPVQVISLDASFGAFALSYSPYGVSIRDKSRDERMASSRMLLLGERLAPPPQTVQKEDTLSAEKQSDPADDPTPSSEDPPSGSGLTPPSSPKRLPKQHLAPSLSSSSLHVGASSRLPFSTAVAETLIVGPNGVCALSPTSSLLRLEALCKERRIDEATSLVDEERRKGRRGEIEGDKATHQGTLRLLHLYLACHLLLETMFEKAGDYFLRGKVDPRLLVRLFPSFRGKTIGSAEEVEVFEGLRETLESMPPIGEIITSSISRNYSPHVSPSTSEAPATLELRKALEDAAKSMLTEVLRKTRQSRRKGGGGRGVDSRKIDIVIDTTFAKLLADAGTTNELLALLAGPNDLVLSELEPFLENRPYVLATVMRQQGRVDRVLEILRSIAEDGQNDPLCEDPVDEIAQQLDGVTDPDMFLKYALWLIQRAPEKGLSLLLSQNPKTGVKLDDIALIDNLRRIDAEIAHRYLEHVVVVKRSPNRALHEALLAYLLDRAAEIIREEAVKFHLEELESEYRLSSSLQPFVVFLAQVAPASPFKTLRLKLILFLQGSPFYDLSAATSRLEAIPELRTELAILLGRQGRNKRALRLLAQDIGDFVSAQTYCTQGGEIVPPRVAHLVATHVPELVGWATLGDVGRRKRAAIDAKVQEGLVMDLLSVYMREGATTPPKQAAALLNAQAVHLDVLNVLELVPNDWSLDVVSTFFQRGLRRELHESATSQILKSIAAGQNLQVSEQFLEKVLQLPPRVVDGPSPLSMPDEGSIAEKEYGSFDMPGEKSAASANTAEKDGGRGNGFFSPEVINKELKEIRDAEGEEEVLR